MTDTVMDIKALPDFLLKVIPTKKVHVKESNGIVQLVPVKEFVDCTSTLRGMFAGDSDMTVDRFLERKYSDMELDL